MHIDEIPEILFDTDIINEVGCKASQELQKFPCQVLGHCHFQILEHDIYKSFSHGIPFLGNTNSFSSLVTLHLLMPLGKTEKRVSDVQTKMTKQDYVNNLVNYVSNVDDIT